MPPEGFKPIIPVFKQSKIGHVSDQMTTTVGYRNSKWLFSNRFPYQNFVRIPCLVHATCTDQHIIIFSFSAIIPTHLYKSQGTSFCSITNYSFLHTFSFIYLPECLVSKHLHCLFLDFIQICLAVFEKLYGETLSLHRKTSSHSCTVFRKVFKQLLPPSPSFTHA
jgi:hypothetical protein